VEPRVRADRENVLTDVPLLEDPTPALPTLGKTGMRLTRQQPRMRFDPKTHQPITLESNNSYKANTLIGKHKRSGVYTDSWTSQSKQVTSATTEPTDYVNSWVGADKQVAKLLRALMLTTQQHDDVMLKHASNSLTTADDEQDQKLTYRSLLKGRAKIVWTRAAEMEFGRLAQGMPGLVAGTDTMRFVQHFVKPSNRIASYCRFVCAHNALKVEQHRVRMTYGGDRTDYTGDVSTVAIDATAVKVHLNSIISTPGARHLTIDIKNFYLGTPLERFEYMRIALKDIPASVIGHYNLQTLEHDGHVMVEIRKGIYGLPQAGLLAKQL
jgi:hypothetical protein